MDRLFLTLGSLSAAVAVALGAFAAHGLQGRIPEDRLLIFETGARYEMYHAVALIAVGLAVAHWGNSGALSGAGWLFAAGTLLFSGSLYLLAVTGVRWLGAITPLGGVAFIVGWLLLAWAAWRGG